MDSNTKQRILELYNKSDRFIQLRKSTPVQGIRKDPTGRSEEIANLGLQYFHCHSNLRIEKGQVPHLILYTDGSHYFTDGENRCWEILLIKSPSGGWYMDMVTQHGALPAPFVHELSGILKFLEEKKDFVE